MKTISRLLRSLGRRTLQLSGSGQRAQDAEHADAQRRLLALARTDCAEYQYPERGRAAPGWAGPTVMMSSLLTPAQLHRGQGRR